MGGSTVTVFMVFWAQEGEGVGAFTQNRIYKKKKNQSITQTLICHKYKVHEKSINIRQKNYLELN